MADDDVNEQAPVEQEPVDESIEAGKALQRALEENRRRSEAMVQAQITNPNPSR